jgi:hypothetical protein
MRCTTVGCGVSIEARQSIRRTRRSRREDLVLEHASERVLEAAGSLERLASRVEDTARARRLRVVAQEPGECVRRTDE